MAIRVADLPALVLTTEADAAAASTNTVDATLNSCP